MRQVTQDSTNISVDIYIVDSTDGTPETGVLWNTSGIDLEYRREGAAAVNVTEATLAALTTAHTDGGFLEIGHGYYRFDVPDAAFASGADSVSVQGTVTGMVVLPQTIQLVAFDTQDNTRLGLTALPNANADAAGGLPISDAGGLDLDAILADTADLQANQGSWLTATGFATPTNITAGTLTTVTTLTNLPAITSNWLTASGIAASALDGKGDWNIGKTGYTVSTVSDKTGYSISGAITTLDGLNNFDPTSDAVANVTLTASCTTNTDMVTEPPTVAAIADGVWDEVQAGHTTAGTFGLYLDSEVSGAGGGSAPTVSEIADGVWDELIAGHAISGSTGEALSAAGAAGDPWITTLPGSYTAGQAGKIIGDNINATISSRMAEASINTTGGAIDTVTAVTNQVTADVTAISGDATAADNLEAMYDGTGYTDETGPASRSQVASLGASSGSAINYAPIGDNTGGALKGVTFVGTQTNLYTDTRTVNGTKHEILHAVNVIDIIYQFNIGSISTPVETEFVGLLNSSNDDCTISAYSYDLSAFEQVGSITGQNDTSTNITENIKLLPDHASDGTTDNIGDVFLRIQTTGSPSSPTLKTDALFLSAVAKSGTLGFENASVWVDTVNGISGTAEGTGTASNPVDNIADARTIADNAANNIKKFHPVSGSNFTLAQSFDDYAFVQGERGFRVDLNGQSVSNCYFMRGNIIGNDSGTNALGTLYESCKMNTNTLGDHATIDCVYGGTTTAGQATTTYSITRPRVDDADRAVTFDINSLADVGVSIIGMDNDFTFLNSVATSFINISGSGGVITIDATCTGGTLNIFGNFTVVDNASGAVTVNDDARYTIQQVREEMDSNSTQLAAIVADTGELQTNQGNWLTATSFATEAKQDLMQTDVSAILVDTAEIGTAGAGLTNINLPNQTMDITGNLSGSVGSVTGGATSAAQTTAQNDLDIITGADGVNLLSSTQSSIDAIENDTDVSIPALIAALNNISTAQVNAECDTAISDAALATAAALATVDTVADAIKVITDQFVFTIANQVDSNIQSINDVSITGDGSGTPFDV